MVLLRVIKGLDHPQDIRLDSERLTIGRDADRDVVIPGNAVSRKHAQIVRTDGRYFIEDLGSRNRTFVNENSVTRQPLRHNDRIRICAFEAIFEDESQADSSSVEARMSHSSFRLEVQPAEKLKSLLEISATLSRSLNADALLGRIGDVLFNLFRQADRCFVILADGPSRLVTRVLRTRRPQEESTARFSRSIVRQCLEKAEGLLIADASAEMDLTQSVLDARLRSVLCAPLVSGADGKAFGVIQLDNQDQRKKFTQDDLKLLCGVANQAAIALENARYHAEQVARERMQTELEVAAQVQQGFLPAELPRVPGYEFYAAYEPARTVGGDYYGFIPLAGGRLAVAVADVAGKGVPAALLMVKLASDARLCLLTEDGAAAAVRRLNDLLFPNTRSADRFVTLCLAVLDPATHKVTLLSAGQGSPLLYRAETHQIGDAMPEDIPGMPLGLLPGCEFATCEVALAPGDALVLFSDGVTDALNTANKPLGLEGVQAAALTSEKRTPRDVGERIHKAVKQHGLGRASQFDDITLVSFGRD